MATTYDRLKAENEELRKRLKSLENADADMDLLFKSKLEKQIYGFLKSKPEAAEFLLQQYPESKSFIFSLGNPKHPLYLPEVQKALKDVVEVEEIQNDISALRDERARLNSSKSEILKELRGYEETLEKTKNEVVSLTAEKQTLENAIKNLHGKPGLDSVKGFLMKVSKFIDDAFTSRDTLESHGGILTLQYGQLDEFRNLEVESAKLKAYLDSNPVTPEDIEKLKTDLEKTRDQIAAELQNAKANLDAAMLKNPEKSLFKISELLDIGIRFMEARPDVKLGPITPSLEEYFVPAKERVDGLIQQFYKLKSDAKEQRREQKRHEKPILVPAGDVPACETRETVDDSIERLRQATDSLEKPKRRLFKW